MTLRGAVGTPGLVLLENNQWNILYALSLAGGFGNTASGRVRMWAVRPDQPENVFNQADLDDLRRAPMRPPLQSADLRTVEAEPVSAVYVTGLVNVQGAIPVPAGAKLSQVRAVAHAGGLRDSLDPREATLWRKLPDGTDIRAKLNVADIIALKEPDTGLQPGDVVDDAVGRGFDEPILHAAVPRGGQSR